MVQLRVKPQGVQEEIDNVEVKAHGQLDRLLPGIIGVTEAKEVEQEIAREDDHAQERVNDVHRSTHAHEHADHASAPFQTTSSSGSSRASSAGESSITRVKLPSPS